MIENSAAWWRSKRYRTAIRLEIAYEITGILDDGPLTYARLCEDLPRYEPTQINDAVKHLSYFGFVDRAKTPNPAKTVVRLTAVGHMWVQGLLPTFPDWADERLDSEVVAEWASLADQIEWDKP